MSSHAFLGAVCVVALLASACADRAPAPRSVLLVTLDTTRADVLSGDASSRALAPRIAALADSGLRFPNAYTTVPLTLPAHASLLTGLVPPRHGLRENGIAALPDSADTLAEILAARGFDTAAFVSCLVLDRGFGLDQGFATYDQPPLGPRTSANPYGERRAEETVRAAAAWLAERRSGATPFLLWVHLYDAHLPYAPDAAHLARAGGDAYRGEIAGLDDAVGALLDALAEDGLDRETLVVLTADHGESLGEHGEPTHGALCYEATVRVPLLLRFPDAPPEPGPTRIASLVDLLPTVLGRLGIAPPPELDGVDLFAADAPAARGVYFESFSGFLNYGWSPLAGWLDPRGKYLHSSEPEFYANVSDPAERKDLAQSHARECTLAREHIAELVARPALVPAEHPEDAELAAVLGALGYARGELVRAELPSPLAPSDRPSPHARVGELEPLLRANALFDQQRYGECRPLVEEIVRANPGHLLALDLLALCLMHAREFERAEELLRRRLALVEVADARLNLGLCELELGRPRQALVEIEAAARLAPEREEIAEARARALRTLGG